jgi:fusaric acid resistance family protein
MPKNDAMSSAVGFSPGRSEVALRATATMLVALGALLSLGRLDLAAYATFGAFTSVYGDGATVRHRSAHQAAIGALLVGAVASGALVATSSHRAWLMIPAAAAWASGASALSDRYGWRPPGPMFFVFAVATCAAVPADPALVAVAAGVAAATAVLAVGLGAAQVGVARGRGVHLPPAAMPRIRQPRHRERVHAVRCGLAVVLAGSAAIAAGLEHPAWAVVAAVVPLVVPGLGHQLRRGVHRLVGTLGGLVLAAGLLALSLPDWGVVIVVAGLQGATELFVASNYVVALLFVTPLALLLVQVAAAQPTGELLVTRLTETVIGVSVGTFVAVATRARERPLTLS